MTSWSRIVVSATALFLVGCGGGANPDRNTPTDVALQETGFRVLDDQGLALSAGEISGAGRLIASEGLVGGADSAHHFSLKFALFDGGRLTLKAFAGRDLEDGFEIEFIRSAGDRLEVFVQAQGDRLDWSEFFWDFNAGQEISLSIDIHNNESGAAHVLFWKDPAGEPFLDSGEHVDGAPGKGLGAAWGVELAGAKLSRAVISRPVDEHGLR